MTPISKNEVEAEIERIFDDCRMSPDEYGFQPLDEDKLGEQITLLLERREAEARLDELEGLRKMIIKYVYIEQKNYLKERIAELKASLNQGGEDK